VAQDISTILAWTSTHLAWASNYLACTPNYPKTVPYDTRYRHNLTTICKNLLGLKLTPKGRRPFYGLFLDFGQAIVDALFVQKISNFWWTCSLVLASRRTNFYKIPILGYTNMPQKHFFFVKRAASGIQKTFYLLTPKIPSVFLTNF
jgi:hypothetical protein